jgi:hypothetical protein
MANGLAQFKKCKDTMSKTRDLLDKWFGLFLLPSTSTSTSTSRMMRVDVIVVPWDQWAFALVGWTGSRWVSNKLTKAINKFKKAYSNPRISCTRISTEIS